MRIYGSVWMTLLLGLAAFLFWYHANHVLCLLFLLAIAGVWISASLRVEPPQLITENATAVVKRRGLCVLLCLLICGIIGGVIGWFNGFLLTELLLWLLPVLLLLWGGTQLERSSPSRLTQDRWMRYLSRVALGLVLAWLIQLVLVMPLAHVTTSASARMIAASQLRQVGIAMHRYHEKHGRLPQPALLSNRGKSLLSWRVLLLPYLDKQDLFERFRLDEPWDSPHNLTLLSEIPDVYRPHRLCRTAPLGHTYLQLYVGHGAVFETGRNLTFKEVSMRDGVSDTLVGGWADQPVPWTKPEDIPYHADQPITSLGPVVGRFVFPIWDRLFWQGSGWPFRSEVLFLDASVRGIHAQSASQVDWQQLRPFITWQGAEHLDWDAWDQLGTLPH